MGDIQNATQSDLEVRRNILEIRKLIGFDYNPSATPSEDYTRNRYVSVVKKSTPKRKSNMSSPTLKTVTNMQDTRRSSRIAKNKNLPETIVKPEQEQQASCSNSREQFIKLDMELQELRKKGLSVKEKLFKWKPKRRSSNLAVVEDEGIFLGFTEDSEAVMQKPDV